MKHSLIRHTTRRVSRVFLLLLCLALLAGCSAAPSNASEDALVDEDAPASLDPAASAETVSPDRKTVVGAEPLDTLPSNGTFAILYVNVGKADAAILRFGETAVLIDTGSAESAPQLIAGLNALGVKTIGAVFITHSHGDHLGGLTALRANYNIPMVYSAYYAETNKKDIGIIVNRAVKLGLPHTELRAGDSVPVADGVSFTVLGPLSLNQEDDNDNSLVLRFSCGGKTFLFVGDMQFAEEQEIIASGTALKSDVLKVGNHGNPDATGDDFGALVSPDFAVISTNTLVDTDSANPRVFAALPTAQIAVTQDYPIGVLLTLDDSGAVTLKNPARATSSASVSVDSFDVSNQTITLVNTGSASVDLSGMILYSSRSDATLRFPEGSALAAGGSLVVGAGEEFAFFGEDKPLSKKKDNTVVLYDRLGSLVSQLEQ